MGVHLLLAPRMVAPTYITSTRGVERQTDSRTYWCGDLYSRVYRATEQPHKKWGGLVVKGIFIYTRQCFCLRGSYLVQRLVQHGVRETGTPRRQCRNSPGTWRSIQRTPQTLKRELFEIHRPRLYTTLKEMTLLWRHPRSWGSRGSRNLRNVCSFTVRAKHHR